MDKVDIDHLGDGICDDIVNVKECTYDGGDCCLLNTDCSYCSICSCHMNSSLICHQDWEAKIVKEKAKEIACQGMITKLGKSALVT